MSNAYRAVQEALEHGADPEFLCMTCPWDRSCFTPPLMTTQEVNAKIAEGEATDRANASREGRMPIAMMVSIMAMSGRDYMGPMCPVFTLRLRGPRGRDLADAMKATMKAWAEQGGDE
jgi:hypothetical protein